jgi:DNA polymerase-3 subunit epsilon/exodeoxyribonuclease X
MLIFIDLETTGIERDDKICSIAVVYENDYKYTLVNEGKKIPSEASSVHHITNEEIKNKPKFLESDLYRFLEENNMQEHTLVAHNAPFIIEKLVSHGFIWKGAIIDTFRVTKHLIPECEFFSLQFLRYELKLYREEKGLQRKYGIKDALIAHNALSDALVVVLLFNYLTTLVEEEKMKELSFENVLLEKFPFGKYKGRYIEEICMNDTSYVQWLLQNATDIDEDIKYSINYYLQG